MTTLGGDLITWSLSISAILLPEPSMPISRSGSRFLGISGETFVEPPEVSSARLAIPFPSERLEIAGESDARIPSKKENAVGELSMKEG